MRLYNAKYLVKVFLFLILAYPSCAQNTIKKLPVESPAAILKDLKSFLKYYDQHLKLSEDFVALNTSSTIISKSQFLLKLSSGAYLPLRLLSKDTAFYMLYKMNMVIDNDIPVLIKSLADTEYDHFKMQNKPLAGLNFIDMDGKRYNRETTKGKIVVLKFWFIQCQKCIEEMPALNELIKQYENRQDIVFVSLALDKEEELKKFLQKRTFNYAVVPDQKKYVIENLKITIFPTHLIINKQGLVTKVVNKYEQMKDELKKLALK